MKQDMFCSEVSDEHITDGEYTHAKRVWEVFGCKPLSNYHDLCVKKDAALLADVFENFRSLCQEQYGLDPAHYYTSPGLCRDALLKKTGVEVKLLTDMKMGLLIKRGLRS